MSEYIYGTDGNSGHWLTGEEIIRCRDCYFGKKVYWSAGSNTPSDWLDCMGPMVETWDYWNDEPQYNPVPPNGFCAWAQRKEMGE